MTATGFDRALEHVMFERLCQHEAGHAQRRSCGLDVHGASANRTDLTVEPAEPDEPAGAVDIRRDDDPDYPRKMALVVLSGPLCEDGRPNWPPSWPLSLGPLSDDERKLGQLVKTLGLDRAGYAALVQEAFDTTLSPEFERLHMAIGELLERGHTLDRHTLQHVKAVATREAGMEHMTLKAVATTTDQGVFEAVISTQQVDREGDVVVAAAMVDALRAWTLTGKRIPLAWNHSTDPEDIIGHIDPATVQEVDGEVVALGWVDQSTERGRQVWRLAKSGTLGFSFGYLIPEGGAANREDGVREIRKLDVFEITATAAPMNADTRVLSTKALDELDEVRTKACDEMVRLLRADEPRVKALPRERTGPIRIASFEC